MVSGFKDWDVPVNISAQTLDQIINRPKYGGSVSINTTVLNLGIGTTSLLTVSGTGMIYAGFLFADCDALNNQLKYELKIDGTTIQSIDMLDLFNFAKPGPNSSPFSIALFDEVNFHYTVHFKYGFTFESSFEISLVNSIASNVDSFNFIYYALI